MISQVESDGLKSNQVKPDESDGIGNVNPFGGRRRISVLTEILWVKESKVMAHVPNEWQTSSIIFVSGMSHVQYSSIFINISGCSFKQTILKEIMI